jgi:hypothetical protein
VLCEVELLHLWIVLHLLALVNILLHITDVLSQAHSATVRHRASAMEEAF